MKKVCGQRTDIRGILRGPRGPKKKLFLGSPKKEVGYQSTQRGRCLHSEKVQQTIFQIQGEEGMFVADGWLDGPASKVLKALLLVCIRPLFLTKLNTVDQHEWENRVL